MVNVRVIALSSRLDSREMTVPVSALAAFCGLTLLLDLISVIVAVVRCRPPKAALAASRAHPP